MSEMKLPHSKRVDDQHVRLWHIEKSIVDALEHETDASTKKRLEKLKQLATSLAAKRYDRRGRTRVR